ncbi:MAG: hypothetical protein QOE92_2170 [Chloroflexota bacterium]|nr:hypothetical protein [Chloroflexota bacterium]
MHRLVTKLSFALFGAAGGVLPGVVALAAYGDEGTGGAGITSPNTGADLPWAFAVYLVMAGAGLLAVIFVVSRREARQAPR